MESDIVRVVSLNKTEISDIQGPDTLMRLQKESTQVSLRRQTWVESFDYRNILEVTIAPNYKGDCLQNTSKPHSYHL